MTDNRRPWKRWVGLGILMASFSRGFEAMGDLAPYADDGVSTERLIFHVTALALLIGAAFCGFKVLRAFIGAIGDQTARPARPEVARVFAEPSPAPQGAQEFDADAAFARYLERKAAGEVEPVSPARPPAQRTGFGRKGA